MGRGRYEGRRVRAFVFDLDGTLVDSGPDIAGSANFTRLHFGLPELPLATVVGFVGDGVERLLERALAVDGTPPPPERVDAGLEVFREHYARHCLDTTRPFPGVFETLRRFSDLPLAVVTNKPRAFTETILSGLHLDGAFRCVVAGDDVARKKPDPEGVLRCLAGLPLEPAEAAVVGDSPNDVLAARAAGCVAVGCTYGLTPTARLREAGPDVLLDAFTELADRFPSRHTLPTKGDRR